ncbi:hypothetical protein BKA66DRAFT_285723 [Pyrenochaeta sp. MPI-SDFR-AT-0127]|nr:hypothetical protein BKA66DRAFT_285723 [Pyrenochaeta sp. MPI-SDFR-AT-0127]
MPNEMRSSTNLLETHVHLHICCLTAQFLCLGFISFCQGHVGPLELFYVNRSQERSLLLGSRVWRENGWHRDPHITMELSQLTCFGQMIEGPLITFQISMAWLEASGQIHNTAQALTVPDVAPDVWAITPNDLSADQKEYHLEATANDIMYTWGPGYAIPSDSDDSMLRAVCIGGGFIYPKNDIAQEFHWEAGIKLQELPQASFSNESKLIVGAIVKKNTTECKFPWQVWRLRCRLVYLGVEEERWHPNQRQLGLQVGPDHVALQTMQVWTRMPATLLKQYQLQQDGIDVLEFLGCFVGVQVSCCTGVARRVSLQDLLADLVPIFSTRWDDWNNQYNAVAGLRDQNLPNWLFDLRNQSCEAFEDLLGTIHRVLNILKPTGLSRNKSYIQIAWPKRGDMLRGIKVSCENESLWAQILGDSVEGVTFAYMTDACLICDKTQCQQQSATWRITTKCLGTAVTRYRDELDQVPCSGTWVLQNGKSYHMWNSEGYVRLRADTTRPETCLFVSKSVIPRFMALRHFYGKRYRRECLLQEHHHPDDAAIEVLILTSE